MGNCGACDLGIPHAHVSDEVLPRFEPQLTESEYHGHKIILSAQEEECYFCRYPASHKVGEEDIYDTHNMTAYVCCNHFWGGCRNTDRRTNDDHN